MKSQNSKISIMNSHTQITTAIPAITSSSCLIFNSTYTTNNNKLNLCASINITIATVSNSKSICCILV
jgi:hypothetical protein